MATTVVNSTPGQATSDNGMGYVLGILLFIVFLGVLLYFGLPYLSRGVGGGTAGTSVNVPSHMDVNVQHSK